MLQLIHYTNTFVYKRNDFHSKVKLVNPIMFVISKTEAEREFCYRSIIRGSLFSVKIDTIVRILLLMYTSSFKEIRNIKPSGRSFTHF